MHSYEIHRDNLQPLKNNDCTLVIIEAAQI